MTAALAAPAVADTATAAPGLSPDQLAAWHRDGFLVIDDVFTPAEVAALRTAADDEGIAAAQRAGGADRQTLHLLGLTGRHPAFLALARDPRLMALLTPLLGPDIQLQHSKLATKPPQRGVGAYAWHQDFAYFPHTNTDLAAVMVMLDDATEDNGCMRMIPGSHREGLREHRVRGMFSGGMQPQLPWTAGVPITPRAGGISIHHCLALHGSPANRSGAARRGVVFQYRADDAHQLGDNVFDDTGLVVAGTRRGVVRCTPGAWILPRVAHRATATDEGFGSVWGQQGARAAVLNADHPVTQPDEPPTSVPATRARSW